MKSNGGIDCHCFCASDGYWPSILSAFSAVNKEGARINQSAVNQQADETTLSGSSPLFLFLLSLIKKWERWELRLTAISFTIVVHLSTLPDNSIVVFGRFEQGLSLTSQHLQVSCQLVSQSYVVAVAEEASTCLLSTSFHYNNKTHTPTNSTSNSDCCSSESFLRATGSRAFLCFTRVVVPCSFALYYPRVCRVVSSYMDPFFVLLS